MNCILRISYQFFIILILVVELISCESNDNTIEDILQQRSEHLIRLSQKIIKRLDSKSFIGLSIPKHRVIYNETTFIDIHHKAYGRTGNKLIEFVHVITLGLIYNITSSHINLPKSIFHSLFDTFNTTLLSNVFPIVFYKHLKSHTCENGKCHIIHMNAESLFNIFQQHDLPIEINKDLINLASEIYLLTCAILWSQPKQYIIQAAIWLMKNKLKLSSSLTYTSVHKRQMNGYCNKIFMDFTIADISNSDVPINEKYWQLVDESFSDKDTIIYKNPICSMNYSFVSDIQIIHNVTNQMIFLSSDGYGRSDDYPLHQVITSNDLDLTLFPQFIDVPDDILYLDMFIAIHSDLFILNPRSTLSTFIYVVRVALGLGKSSVPRISNRDIYCFTKKEYKIFMKFQKWISYDDILRIYDEIQIE